MKKYLFFWIEILVVFLAIGTTTKEVEVAMFVSILSGMALIYTDRKGDL